MKLKLKRPASKSKPAPDKSKDASLDIPDALKRKPAKGGPSRVIEFKITGGRPVVKSWYRTFALTADARQYYVEFCNKRLPDISASGRNIGFKGSNDEIATNWDIRQILKNAPIPKEGLPTMNPEPTRGLSGEVSMPVAKVLEKRAKEGTESPKERTAMRSTGNVIELKTLCAELKIEPRDARMKLRKAAKDRVKYPEISKAHDANARWEFPKDSAFLKEVQGLLGKK